MHTPQCSGGGASRAILNTVYTPVNCGYSCLHCCLCSALWYTVPPPVSAAAPVGWSVVTGDILLTKNLPVYVNLKPDQPEVWETALYSLVKPRQLYKASQPDMEFLKLWVSKWILEVWEAWGHGLMVPVISHRDIYIYILYIVKWERQEENVVEWEYALCLVSHHLSSNGGCDRCKRIYVFAHKEQGWRHLPQS